MARRWRLGNRSGSPRASRPPEPPPADEPAPGPQAPQDADATGDIAALPAPAARLLPAQPVRDPLANHPVVRSGAYAWGVIGILLLVVALARVVQSVSIVVIPLVLALFPAAVLAPLVQRLKRNGIRPALATTMVLLGSIALVAGLFALLAPQVEAELGDLGDRLVEGYEKAESFLAAGPFGFEPIVLDDLIDRARERLAETEGLGEGALEVAIVVAEGFAGLILALFALFFYLKDGERIAGWARDLFPQRVRADVQAIGDRVWFTIGAYIRGQLIIAFVDAVFIGIGLVVLRVPLALPLAVLVFFGGLFPIVGAVAAGIVAVLVALATGGIGIALLVLALIVAVQQLESHLLAPLVLGRATELHPLAVIAALTAGAVLLGVLGAFLSVPIAASGARAVGYLRQRVPG